MTASLPQSARLALTLAIAFAGGGLFASLGLPAPWLAGAMLSTALASLAGLPVILPGWVRNAAFVIVGLQVGASFTMDSIATASQWPVSLIILALTVAALIWSGYMLFTRVFGWDGKTSLFAANPGALSMTLAMAEHYGADLRRVPAVQSLRLFFLVAVLPFAAMSLNGEALVPVSGAAATDPSGLALVVLAGAAAGYGAWLIGTPAGFLLGAMLANGLLHLTGAVAGGMPDGLLIPAFVVLGTMIGVRFQDFGVALMRQVLAAGLAGFAVSLVVATTGAALASGLTGLPLMATMLAFAPGGLEVMTILALTLGLNPAFVAAHQIARFVGLNLTLPIISQFITRRIDK